MNWRQHLFWMVYAALLLVVGGPLMFLLLRSRSGFAEARAQLRASEAAYERLTSATPFPSRENVNVVQADLERARALYTELRQTLCRGDIRPEELARDLFGERLQVTRERLLAMAEGNGVELPDEFFFGFERYAAGILPEDQDIPRLTVQLKCVEHLVSVLLETRIESIADLRREVFESGEERTVPLAPARGARVRGRTPRRAELAPSTAPVEEGAEAPFAVEPLAVTFTARDEQVWDVLDRLATISMFAVPSSVTLTTVPPPEGTRPSPEAFLRRITREAAPADPRFGGPGTGPGARRPEPAGGPDPEAIEAILRDVPHEERVLAGRRERVRVELELDVYRFCVGEDPIHPRAEAGGTS